MKKFALTLLAGTFVSGAVSAQSVHYGTLESIFGEPVTTSATGKPQRASEAPVAMTIISSEEIRRSGAKDIPQILQRVAGVEVNRAENGAADVTIRGYNQPLSNRLLVLINGRQVLTDGFGFVPWTTLPVQMNEIRQIEVVKGPNSSLFGFNAEQGVVNIITFSPLNDDIDVVNAKIGTREHREINAVNTIKFNDNQALRMSGGFLIADGYNRDGVTDNSLTGGNKDSSNVWDRRTVSLDHEWQIDGSSQLRTQLSHVNGKSSTLLPFGGSGKSTDHDRTDAYHLNYKKQSDYGLWDVTAYRNTYQTQGVLGYDNDLNVLKVENLFKYGKDHAFRIGGEYRYNSITGAVFGDGNAKFDYDLWAPSAMWDWKISPKLAWTNSIRYDHVTFGRDEVPALGGFTSTTPFDRIIEEVSFNSGMVYNLTNTDKVRLSAARGLHIPSLIEMGSAVNLAPLPAGFVGNPFLQTERNLTVELGYNKSLAQHNAEFGASLFWTKMENVIAPDIQVGSPTLFAFQEGGDSETVGLELEAKGKYNDWLRWGANYTYITVEDDDNNSGLLHFEGTQPKHQASVYGGFDFCKNWEIDGDLHYVSGTRQRAESNIALANQVLTEDIDGYFVFNARVGYNYNDNTSVSIDGFNLVDKHREWYYNNGTTGPVGGNTLGRTVLLSVNHKF